MGKKRITKDTTAKLLETVIDAILDKKGEELVSLDLSKISNTICKYFVICETGSSTHALAIADYIEEKVKKTTKEKVWHKEGTENAHWILLDYFDVIIHIFQRPYRAFYKLEDLWADAEITSHENKI